MRDPYATLGVPKSASEKEIKSAFRKLAKQHHPDASGSDPKASARFNEANQAYEILGDKEKRAQYDRGEIDADGKPKFQGFEGFNAGSSPFGAKRGGAQGFRFSTGAKPTDIPGADGMFADFFDQAFSGSGGSRRTAGGGFSAARNASARGEDIRATLKVRLEDVVSDEKVEAVFPSGKRVAIRLPDGVEDGQTIRLRGQGQSAAVVGAPDGDAMVTIAFEKHPRFEVTGRDLVLTVPVSLRDAVLGGKVFVETLEGRVALTLPPWSNTGKTLRLKGKGLTRKGGGRGDILVNVSIVLPAEPDEKLAEFLRQQHHASA